ncbi:MAG: hypothetical protein WA843_05060, partial [Candidatus Saccharimonadales bacterium]
MPESFSPTEPSAPESPTAPQSDSSPAPSIAEPSLSQQINTQPASAETATQIQTPEPSSPLPPQSPSESPQNPPVADASQPVISGGKRSKGWLLLVIL